MISSTKCSNRLTVLSVAAAILLWGCSSAKIAAIGAPLEESVPTMAVFPVENLSGAPAPLKLIREALLARLKTSGFRVLDDGAMERFMVRNRIRYTSGMDGPTAMALRKETGTEAVLMTSLEFYSETAPPKIALTSRLVQTSETPRILWVDGVGMAGDDAPGILDMGLIEDPSVLLRKALQSVVGSLREHFLGRLEKADEKALKKEFAPRIAYRSPTLDSRKKYTVAIIPFFNQSERRNAGDIVMLQFMRSLRQLGGVEVIEPGVVRNAFLSLRIIMEEGVSLSDATALFATLDADMVLTGKVLDYQDYHGMYGKPKVGFSAQLLERESRKVVWSSHSHNNGDDGVVFFDVGRVNTAHEMAVQMTGLVGRRIVGVRN